MGRVIFFGSPSFAVPSLEKLVQSEFAPTLVVTQPDRPAGRGRRQRVTAVRAWAEERGLPVMVLESFRDEGILDILRGYDPDFFVVVSFGLIFPESILGIPRWDCINLHASLLPAYRGASPINAAIVNGESVTGVTTIRMVKELDAGPIYLKKKLAIDPEENAGELSQRLAPLGASLLLETLQRICSEGLQPQPQPEQGISFAPKLRKQDGEIIWNLSALEVHNRIRGMNPWPGSYTHYRGVYLRVHRATVADSKICGYDAGTIVRAGGERIEVACGVGTIRILELQAQGRRVNDAASFLRGFELVEGEKFGS